MYIPKKKLAKEGVKVFGRVTRNDRKVKDKNGNPVLHTKGKLKGEPMVIERWKAEFAHMNADDIWSEPVTYHLPSEGEAWEWIALQKTRQGEVELVEKEEAAAPKIIPEDMPFRDYTENFYIPSLLKTKFVEGVEKPVNKYGREVAGYARKAVEYFGYTPIGSIQRPQLLSYSEHIVSIKIRKVVGEKMVDGKKEKIIEMVRRTDRSLDSYLGRLEFLFNAAVEDGVIRKKPSFKGVRPTEFDTREQVVEPFEHLALLAACPTKVYRDKRTKTYMDMKPVLIGLRELGCRPDSELHKILVGDVHIDPDYPGLDNETEKTVRGYVTITEGKIHPGKKQTWRQTPITFDLMKWIEEDNIMKLPPEKPLFGPFKEHDAAWKALKKLAGITRKLGLGAYRHTCFTDAALARVPTDLIQRWYGHSEKSLLTPDYTHLSPERAPEFSQEENRKLDILKAKKDMEAMEKELLRRRQEIEKLEEAELKARSAS